MTREHDYPGQPRNGGAERTATSPIAASQSGQSLGPTKRKGVALEPTRRHRSAPRGPILLDLQQRARPLAGSGVETPVLSQFKRLPGPAGAWRLTWRYQSQD